MSDSDSSDEDVIESKIKFNPSYNPQPVVRQQPQHFVQKIVRYENSSSLSRISGLIGHALRRPMTQEEIGSLRNYVNTLNQSRLNELSTAEADQAIVAGWLKSFQQLYDEDVQIDTHEINRQAIGLSSETDGIANRLIQGAQQGASVDVNLYGVAGLTKPEDIRQFLNPEAQVSRARGVLDSRWRRLDIGGITSFGWNYSNNQNNSQGNVTVLGSIRDIRSIKIFPFRIPYPMANEDGGGADNAYKLVTLLISEFANQSIVAQENKRYHFMFEPTNDGDTIILDPTKYGDGKYTFDKPITQLDTLTVSFGSPLSAVSFDNDRQTVTFSAGNPTTITTPQAHYLSTSDVVIFSDFTTTLPLIDSALISQINSSNGFKITVESSTTFTINVDTSAVVPSGTCTAYYASKRFFINFEIEYYRSYAFTN